MFMEINITLTTNYNNVIKTSYNLIYVVSTGICSIYKVLNSNKFTILL